MMFLPRFLVSLACLLLPFISPVSSRTPSRNEECIAALLDVYGELQFDGPGYGDYYASSCGNPSKVASMYAAANVYCNPAEKAAGLSLWNGYCVQYGPGPAMPESAVAVNTSESAIKRMQVINSTEDAATTNYTDPVMLSESLFRLAYRTEVSHVCSGSSSGHVLTPGRTTGTMSSGPILATGKKSVQLVSKYS